MLLPDWLLQVGSILIGTAAIVLALSLGISQFKKLGSFLAIGQERPGWREGKGKGPPVRERRHMPAPPDDRPALPDRPELPRHEPKIMLISLIKFAIVLFIMTVLTYRILVYPMILIWAYALFFTRKYIILWNAHKYSVPALILAGLAAIGLGILAAPAVRALLALLLTLIF